MFRWIVGVAVVLYGITAYWVYQLLVDGSREFEPEPLPAPHRRVTFGSRRTGHTVHADLLYREEAQRALISVHGYNMSRHSDFHQRRAVCLWEAGYTVLSVDLADHGGETSHNGRIGMGAYEQWDVLGAFDYLQSRGYQPESIGIVGESMGAVTALLAAAHEPQLRAIWTDSPYSNLIMVLRERLMGAGYPGVLVYGAMLWGALRHGERWWEIQPLTLGPQLAQHGQAVYLAASDADTVVPLHHSRDLYRAYTAQNITVDLWTVPDAEHGTMIIEYTDDYMTRLNNFFDRHLS